MSEYENEVLRKGIFSLVVRPEDRLTVRTSEIADDFIKGIEHITDTSYLKTILKLAQYVDTVSIGMHQTIQRNLHRDDGKWLRIAHAHIDTMRETGVGLDDLMRIYARLAKDHGAEPDSDFKVPTIKAHAYAHSQYGNYAHHRFYGFSYTMDAVYIAAVEKYHEHAHALVAYRNARATRDFDEHDFQQYLKQGALAEGWL